MLIGCIEGATRVLGRPADWNEERDGHCGGLPILDAVTPDGAAVMISSWQPTQADIDAMIAGRPLHLWVFGRTHPVVALGVAPA